jgi:hypothetical protein
MYQFQHPFTILAQKKSGEASAASLLRFLLSSSLDQAFFSQIDILLLDYHRQIGLFWIISALQKLAGGAGLRARPNIICCARRVSPATAANKPHEI